MTDTAAITAFIETQISEDAKTATGLQSMVTSLSELNDRLPPASRRGTHVYDAGLWALGRVLAEVEAKRQLLAFAARNAWDVDGEWGDGCTLEDIVAGKCDDRGRDAYMEVARPLAAPYAGREGWDEDWAL